MDEEDCCPRFDPGKWDEKTVEWEGRHFIRETMPLLFHMPYPPLIGRKIAKMVRLATTAGKMPQEKENTLILFSDPNPFKSEMLLSVSGPVKDAHNVTISGKMVSKVFDGPYNDIPKYIKTMVAFLEGHDYTAKKYYVHYAYCPKCAKKFGHNYMILFAAV